MYGLEKEKPSRAKFDFDLEKELKDNPKRIKELSDQASANIHEIKSTLRAGQKTEGYDKLGTLLSGYDALLKVIQRISK